VLDPDGKPVEFARRGYEHFQTAVPDKAPYAHG
jgi:hypothetical protein